MNKKSPLLYLKVRGIVVQSSYHWARTSCFVLGWPNIFSMKCYGRTPNKLLDQPILYWGCLAGLISEGEGGHQRCQGDLWLWQQDSEKLWRVTIMRLSNPKGILRSAQAWSGLWWEITQLGFFPRVLPCPSLLNLHPQEVTLGPMITLRCGDGCGLWGLALWPQGHVTDHTAGVAAAVVKLLR